MKRMQDNTQAAEGASETADDAPNVEVSHSDIASALGFLGLSDVEIQVYRTLLELGTRPAGMVALKAGLKRGHTYNVLGQLMGKGVVQEFIKNNVRHFTCSAPDSLLSLVENQEEELKMQKERLRKVIPLLESLRNPIAARPKVRFFQGVDGVKEIFEDMLRGPSDRIFGVCDITHSWRPPGGELSSWSQTFLQRRIDRGIWFYGILNQSPESDVVARDAEANFRVLKRIEGVRLPVELNIYGSKVALVSTKGETVGLLIEHPPVAEMLRNLFNAVWQYLPDYTIDDGTGTKPAPSSGPVGLAPDRKAE